jgi:hypothetical protein
VKKFLLKASLSFAILAVFILAYGSFCDFFFTQKRFLDIREKKQWILAQQGGEYDYAVLGSSRAFGAFDMNLLDSLTGMNGINLGANGSGFKDNYLVMSLFLKKNKIKKLFLQVDMASLNSKTSFSNEFHAFTFMPFWEEQEVQGVLKEEIPHLNSPITALFPQWRYFYFNKYFSPKEVLRRVSSSTSKEDTYSKSKGGIGNEVGTSVKQEIKTYNLPKTADPGDWNYLKKIISLAETAGIETLFFTAPRYKDNQQELKKILAQFPIQVVLPKGFDNTDSRLFKDQGHLNGKGRKHFTMGFTDLITNSSSRVL